MKILLAYDNSEHSKRALEYAANMGPDNEVTVLSVADPSTVYSYSYAEQMGAVSKAEEVRKLGEETKEAFNKAAENAAAELKKKGINASGMMEIGNAGQTVCKVAREGNYDVIVMGSRGLSGVK